MSHATARIPGSATVAPRGHVWTRWGLPFGSSCSRGTGLSVVIGSAVRARGNRPGRVALTIRTFNSHMTRVQMVTCDQLLDDAQRALALAAATG